MRISLLRYLNLFMFLAVVRTIAFSQDSLNIKNKVGVTLSIKSGFLFENVGLKYWISNDAAFTSTLGFSVADRTPETTNYGFVGKYESDELTIGLGFQYVIMSIDDGYCYLALGSRYGTSRYDETIPVSPSVGGGTIDWHESVKQYELNVGAGIEYWLSKHFTVSGQYLALVTYTTLIHKSTGSSEQRALDRDFNSSKINLIFSVYL